MEDRTKRKIEANVSMGRDYMRLGGIGVLILAGLFLLYRFGTNAYLFFASSDKDGPLIWSTDAGIGHSENGGLKDHEYALPSRLGDPIKNPKYAVKGDVLAYFSPADKSLCILTPGQPEKWVDVGSFIGDASVLRVRPSKRGFRLLAYGSPSFEDGMPAPSAGAEVDLSSDSALALTVSESLQDPTTGKTIDHSGSNFKTSGGSTFKDAPSKIMDWDFDFTKGWLLTLEHKAATMQKADGTKSTFGLGMLFNLRSAAAPKSGEAYIEAVKPFKAGHLLVSFDSSGARKKVLIKDEKSIRPPYVKPSPAVITSLMQANQRAGEN